MMQRIAFLLAILSAPPSFAETAQRCGTDAFGNTVCMDKDGVVSIVRQAAQREDKSAGENAVNGGKDAVIVQPRRCAVDDFGNTVCAEK